MKTQKPKRIFLDYASATPLLPEVFSVITSYTKKHFANPSALYKEAIEVEKDIALCRKEIATILRAQPDEIVFTGSGTEADNLAILGVIGKLPPAKGKSAKPHVIVSAFEHSAIIESVKKLEKDGVSVTYLNVSRDGYVKPEDVLSALTPQTVLVSVMYANNEIGTIQPIKDIAKAIRYYKKSNSEKISQYFGGRGPLFHADASQASNYLSLDVLHLGVDLMTLDSAKVYGPKGIGILFVKRGIAIDPQIVGGGQESGRRSGTENTPAIVGFAKALSIVQKDRDKETRRLAKLRDYGIREIQKRVPQCHINGGSQNLLPNTINICFPGSDAEFLVLKLDARGIAVSSSSACQSKKEDSRSKVIAALGVPGCDGSSLRITLGRFTTKSDITRLIHCFPEILK